MSAECTLPLAEAAHRLGLSWAQMYRLALTGEVRAEKRGGRWFVAGEDVAAAADRGQGGENGLGAARGV